MRSIVEYDSYPMLEFLLKDHMETYIDAEIDRISFIFKGNVQWAVKMYENFYPYKLPLYFIAKEKRRKEKMSF